MPDLIGQMLGRYQILEELGAGGMASVYKAFDIRLERYVAIKIIRPDLFRDKIPHEILKRFEREARALARLSHPNIVKIHDFGEHNGLPFLVMECISAGTLKSKTGSTVPYKEAVDLLLPIARALEYAHQRNVIHRDIKPANILLTEEGIPMLTDFGIAKIIEARDTDRLTDSGTGIGTPDYMAPEQWLGEILPQSDMYSLGVIFYELLTGRLPYAADSPGAVLLKQANEPLPLASSYVSDLPEKVDRLLCKALAKEPEDRFGDMAEMIAVLEELACDDLTVEAALPAQREDDSLSQGALHVKTEPTRTLPTSVVISTQPDAPAESYVWLKNLLTNRLVIWGAIFTFLLGSLVFGLFTLFGGKDGHEPIVSIQPSVDEIVITPFVIDTSAMLPIDTPTPELEITGAINSPAQQIMPTPITRKSDVDGMQQVYVPSGEFQMGSPESLAGAGVDEKPLHTVYLDAFWIDQTEVTNSMFGKFIDQTGYRTDAEKRGSGFVINPENGSWIEVPGADWRHPRGLKSSIKGLDFNPVIQVSWSDAQAYCKWAGKRLPTEAEWEKAARGTNRATYPWGEKIDCQHANYSLCGKGEPKRVGSYPFGASIYGALDLAGNVHEWVADHYVEDFYYNSPAENPIGPASGVGRVTRGGAWDSTAMGLRSAARRRVSYGYWFDDTGFRCVTSE